MRIVRDERWVKDLGEGGGFQDVMVGEEGHEGIGE